MKSRIPFVSIVFLCLLAFACKKSEPYEYYEPKIYLRALPDNQRVKLYFYQCNYNVPGFPSFPGFGCNPDLNAYFEVYQMNPDGTEKSKLASNVTDSFYVEGLTNGEQYHFKLKSRVGRTYSGESGIVVTTPGVLAALQRLQVAQPNFLTGLPYYSPDLKKMVQTFYSDTLSGIEIINFDPYHSRNAPYSLNGPVNWDASSRYFMGIGYKTKPEFTYQFAPYLYDTETDSLMHFTNLIANGIEVQMPILAPDQQHFYFLSNEDNSGEYRLWTAKIDGSQKLSLANGFKFRYVFPGYNYNQPQISLSCSNDGRAVYASFQSPSGNEQDGLYQIDPVTGAFERLLDDKWLVQAAQPSPDHRGVLFHSYRSGESAFWFLDLSTGVARQVASLPPTAYSNTPFYWADNNHIIVTTIEFTGYAFYKIKINI